MIINKNSWHYRFMAFTGGYPYSRRTLCEYVRGLVIAFLKSITVVGVVGFISAFVLSALGVALLSLFMTLDPSWNGHIMVGTIFWLFLLSLVSLAGGKHLYLKHATHKQPKPKLPPGPVKQWMKDRHDKVCRLITFTE